MRMSLTDRQVKTIALPETGRKEVFDTGSPGLSLRITPKGGRSWSLLYRFAGELRRDSIGKYPTVSLSDARQKAREMLELVASGSDPRMLVADQEAAEAAKRANTVAFVAAQFIEKKASEIRWKEPKRVMVKVIEPRWRDRPITEITRKDVRELVEAIAKSAPIQANRTLTVLSMFFKWCVEQDILAADPTRGVKKTTEDERTRELNEAEIKAFWNACDQVGFPFGTIAKLLLLTGQRKGDIGSMRWSEINWRDKLVVIPKSRYKTKRDHVVPLAPMAFSILDDLRIKREAREAETKRQELLCFSTTGTTPVSGFSRAKRKFDALMQDALKKDALDPEGFEVEDWRYHDLRRTASTQCQLSGVPDHIVNRIRGKTEDKISRTYNCYSYLEERREGLAKLERRIELILGPPPANVTPMKRRAET